MITERPRARVKRGPDGRRAVLKWEVRESPGKDASVEPGDRTGAGYLVPFTALLLGPHASNCNEQGLCRPTSQGFGKQTPSLGGVPHQHPYRHWGRFPPMHRWLP